jgi:hypothetical protein
MGAPSVSSSAKHAFDNIALFVEHLVVRILDLAVLAGRDDGFGVAFGHPFAQLLAVIALIGDRVGRWRRRLDMGPGDPEVADIAGA